MSGSQNKTNAKSAQREHRNRVERQRQSEIDDEIQKLMCFLPPPANGRPRVLSRNQILKGVYELAVKIKKEEAEAEAEQKKKEEQEKEQSDQDGQGASTSGTN